MTCTRMTPVSSNQAYSKRRHGLFVRVALGVALLAGVRSSAAEHRLECNVVYESAAGVYVDIGGGDGLLRGDAGVVLRSGETIARVEVVEVSPSTAMLRGTSVESGSSPKPGDRVEFIIDEGRGGRGDASPPSPRSATGEEEEFVPLLTPPERRSVGLTRASDMFHGQLWMRQQLQLESSHDANYSITRVGSSGSYERIGGSPWTLHWSGFASYRAGQAFSDLEDFHTAILRVQELNLFRRFDDVGFIRVGRFLPRALPGAGYIDGAQVERPLSSHFSLGMMAGLKPTRDQLHVSVREPVLVPYATVAAGRRQGLYYSGTAGVLGSLYEGKPDRLALLLDQTFRINPRISLYSTLAVDFDVGAAEYRSGVSLTRLDLYADYKLAPLLRLRGGLDHYERPDTEAERDTLPLVSPDLFDDGYWRYFIGASHELPWKLRLSEELAWIDSDAGGGNLHWTVSLTKRDLPWLPGSSATISLFNLAGTGAQGYGGRLLADIPLLRRKLSIVPSMSARTLDVENDSEKFQLADVSLAARWRISRAWSLDAGFTRAFGTEIGAYIFDLGLRFAW